MTETVKKEKEKRKLMGNGHANGVHGYEMMSSAVCIF